jgi:hypothetical protein
MEKERGITIINTDKTKQCDIHVVMCSLLVEMQETIDYLKESRDYWRKQGELKKVISYDTCISQMEDVLSGYKNYT